MGPTLFSSSLERTDNHSLPEIPLKHMMEQKHRNGCDDRSGAMSSCSVLYCLMTWLISTATAYDSLSLKSTAAKIKSF